MIGAIVVIMIPAVFGGTCIALSFGWGWAPIAFVQRRRRSSVITPLTKAILSPAMGGDWRLSDQGTLRIEIENRDVGVSAWAYSFSKEAHLFKGGKEIALAGWEQWLLNRCLRKRQKSRAGELASASAVANDELVVELAESFVSKYSQGLAR
jgi:hypothetical protein